MARHRRGKMVHINRHAWEQYRARGGDGNLNKLVESRLKNMLRKGARITGENLIVEVPVSPELKAICTPKATGGWLCITVLERDWHIA